jgi:hypothetical protein
MTGQFGHRWGLVMEHIRNVPCYSEVPIGGKVFSIRVKCQPLSLIGHLASPGCRFAYGCSLIHFVDHGKATFDPVHLNPDKGQLP